MRPGTPRWLLRGAGDGAAVGHARAPHGAVVTIDGDASTARATVRLDVHPLGAHLPGVTVTATAVADREPEFGSPGTVP